MVRPAKITVDNMEISVISNKNNNDYICLTDLARYKDNDPSLIISHWMRLRNTLEFLGAWECLNNPNFNQFNFGGFMLDSGYNGFTMSPKKWIESTKAIGIYSKSGRYGGTYAHKDIAFSFCMWLSPVFQLYVVKQYQTLKEKESNPLIEQWNVKRILSKTNYMLHTDAIKNHIIPALSLIKKKESIVYASEADMLNMALFGCRAKDWEEANPDLVSKKLNLRDMASINQLVVLSNMESYNSEMIKHGIEKSQRYDTLCVMAQEQLELLDRNQAENQFKMLDGDFERLHLLKDENEQFEYGAKNR